MRVAAQERTVLLGPSNPDELEGTGFGALEESAPVVCSCGHEVLPMIARWECSHCKRFGCPERLSLIPSSEQLATSL